MIELYGCQSCPDCRRVKGILSDRGITCIDISTLSPEELSASGIRVIPTIRKDGELINVKGWTKGQLLELVG